MHELHTWTTCAWLAHNKLLINTPFLWWWLQKRSMTLFFGYYVLTFIVLYIWKNTPGAGHGYLWPPTRPVTVQSNIRDQSSRNHMADVPYCQICVTAMHQWLEYSFMCTLGLGYAMRGIFYHKRNINIVSQYQDRRSLF